MIDFKNYIRLDQNYCVIVRRVFIYDYVVCNGERVESKQ